MTDHEDDHAENDDNELIDADADFLRRWASWPGAADTSVRLPEDPFLRRWLGHVDDPED